ncbi:MAG TPA: response regulator [Deltaproteobacteria bacterium]|nr:response regulator [Deltaproteobacteria bacterium]
MIDLEKMKVLIVDDSEGMRKSIRGMMMVLKYGNSFHFGEDGKEGWRILKEKPIDLAILDWNMPNMNGIELLDLIREDRKLRDMPVVMVTAEANKEMVAEAAESDIDGYILKPLTIQSIGDKIAQVIDKVNNPSPMVMHLRKARALEEAGDIDAAIVEAKRAVFSDNKSSRPIRELAYYYYKKGHINEAKKWFMHAADMNKLDVFAYHYLGQIYLERNQIEKAAQCYHQAMNISPRHIDRALDFGKILARKGMHDSARKVFNKALSLTDDPLSLHEALADFSYENEMYSYSIELMKYVVRHVRTRSDLFLKIGKAYEKTGEYKEALQYFLESAKTDDGIEVKLHIAEIYLLMKQKLRAEGVIKTILEIDPYHSEARTLLRKCL